jgi:hypothetical protein
MNLKSYLNLYSLLDNDTSTIEERRAFGLADTALINKPIAQLLVWENKNLHILKKPLLSDTISSYLYTVTFALAIIAFIFGFLSGMALLSYNGHEPVNVVYFIAMVVFLPILTMTLTLFSIYRANSEQSVLVHLSPAYWMERILKFFPNMFEKNLKDIKINPLLTNWIVIKRSQFIALLFSVGLLLSLLAVVATKDIAFAWSTTLHISPEAFHSYLNVVAFPWREFFPSAVPSLSLIEQSQYFRLGDSLSAEMIKNASKLGEWWKFLAFATLFYALLLRLMMYIFTTFGYQQALRKSFLSLKGVQTLLTDMNEPMITTNATVVEHVLSSVPKDIQYMRKLEPSYDFVQGWSIAIPKLLVINDTMQITGSNIFEVGGSNTLSEDSEIANKSFGEVLLIVKAWEPPTLDIIDYIEALTKYAKKIVVCPVGTEDEIYIAKEKFINIWVGKLSLIKSNKIWIKIS